MLRKKLANTVWVPTVHNVMEGMNTLIVADACNAP